MQAESKIEIMDEEKSLIMILIYLLMAVFTQETYHSVNLEIFDMLNTLRSNPSKHAGEFKSEDV